MAGTLDIPMAIRLGAGEQVIIHVIQGFMTPGTVIPQVGAIIQMFIMEEHLMGIMTPITTHIMEVGDAIIMVMEATITMVMVVITQIVMDITTIIIIPGTGRCMFILTTLLEIPVMFQAKEK
jgi:hypothetical protein